MALDVKAIYDEAIANVADQPLDKVRVVDVASLLGGKPLASISPREVLSKFKVGLAEAGAIQTPRYGQVNWLATTGGAIVQSMGPPEGVTWRVTEASGAIFTAGNVPALTETTLVLGFVSQANVSPHAPVILGGTAGTLAAQSVALGQATILDYHDPAWAGPVSWHGSMLMRYPDAFVLWGAEPGGGDFSVLSVNYHEWPGSVVPPP